MIRAAGNPANAFFFDLMNAAAKKLGIRLVSVDIHGTQDLEAGFARIDTDAAFLLLDPVFVAERRRIAEIAIKRRLMLVSAERMFAEAGVVATQGANMAGVMRATAVYVDKILRGANPADLPVEQPTTLELVINRRTVNSLGLTIPAALLLRADHVIE